MNYEDLLQVEKSCVDMKKQVVSLLDPFSFIFTIKNDKKKTHNMLSLMLYPCFKSL
jgi:hypothetical protein